MLSMGTPCFNKIDGRVTPYPLQIILSMFVPKIQNQSQALWKQQHLKFINIAG